jgi:hypothetical protein
MLAEVSEQLGVAGGSFAGAAFMEYSLGYGWDTYRDCLERSGWTEDRFRELLAAQ